MTQNEQNVRTREEQKWDGFPQNPNANGFHWLKQNGCGRLIPFEWEPVDELWLFDCESDDCYPDSVKKMFKYHGPCLPPEARGAAEQRRKDAKGQTVQVPSEGPFLIVFQEDGIKPELFAGCGARAGAYERFENLKSSYHCRLYAAIDSSMKHDHENGALLKPANVAALEARIAELVGERDRMRDALIACGNNAGAFFSPEVSTDFLVDFVPSEVRLKIASLTREGGVRCGN